jgi:DNA polymerase III epsilon subunit-like protein
MKFLVFDTETTGFIPKPRPLYTEHEKFPYIVQLSYIVFDKGNMSVSNTQDFIVSMPKNVSIPKSTSNIHGITTRISRRDGNDILYVLSEFYKALDDVALIVGHNLQFDINMVIAESYRNLPNFHASTKYSIDDNFVQKFRTKRQYCTMRNGVTTCNLLSKGADCSTYFKWPRLEELYKVLFNTTVKNTHNALVDVLMTLRCYCKMLPAMNTDICAIGSDTVYWLFNENVEAVPA